MNKLVIQGAGFPVQKKTFDFIQEAYGAAITHLCKMHGDNLILYGVELVDGNRTAGAVVINGELLTFEASPDNAKILIDDSQVEPAQYQNGELIPAYYTRVAKCSAIGTVNLADLTRVKPIETGWIECPLQEGATYAIYENIPPIQAKINRAGRCIVRGICFTQGQGLLKIAKIPFSVYDTTYFPVYSDGQAQNLQIVGDIKGFGYVGTDSIIYIDTSKIGEFRNFAALMNFELLNVKF